MCTVEPDTPTSARQRSAVLKSGSFTRRGKASSSSSKPGAPLGPAKGNGPDSGNGSKAAAAVKQPSARAKRSRMQTTDSHYEANTGFQVLSF